MKKRRALSLKDILVKVENNSKIKTKKKY